MIGDCTRTPALLAVTRQLFNKEELNRTLNSLECIARGAALQSAILNPTFQVKTFAMKDYNSLPVNISYGFKDLSAENAAAPETKVYPRFFTLGQKFPLTQKLEFNNKIGGVTLAVNYDENAGLMQGLPGTIAKYEIGTTKLTKQDKPDYKTKLTIRIRNNIHQIPELDKEGGVTVTESWTEEEKIPVGPPPKKPEPASTAKKEEEASKDEDKKEDNSAAADSTEKKEEAAKAEEPPAE